MATAASTVALANAWLAAIVESADEAIASKTLDGIVTSWNPAAEKLFGYAADEIIGRHILILAAPGRENEMPQILERVRRGEKIDHYETVRRRKDGSLVNISLTVSPIRDEAGRIIGASKIARDITESKRIEEALRASEERFRNLANAVPDMVWTADPDGTSPSPTIAGSSSAASRRSRMPVGGRNSCSTLTTESAAPRSGLGPCGRAPRTRSRCATGGTMANTAGS